MPIERGLTNNNTISNTTIVFKLHILLSYKTSKRTFRQINENKIYVYIHKTQTYKLNKSERTVLMISKGRVQLIYR